MTLPKNITRITTAAIVAAFSMAHPLLAQDVTLKGKDSQLNITGILLSADDGKFVVKTAIGEFEIAQDLVSCEGEACPEERDIAFDLELVGEGKIASVLVPMIVEGFASTLDAEMLILDSNGNPVDEDDEDKEEEGNEDEEGESINMAIVDFEGEEVANFRITELSDEDALTELVNGSTQIIFSDDNMGREERDFVKAGGGGDLASYEQDRVIAVEGFAVVVNPKNAVGAMTIEQAAQIFAGVITDWSDLGGAPGPIHVYTYDSNTEAFSAIENVLLEDFELEVSEDASIVRSAGELTEAVMRDEAAFSVVNFNSKRGARVLPLINGCGMTIYPTPFSIKTEEYPLGHRVHVYDGSTPEGYAKQLLDYIDGPDLDGLVSKAGFFDLSVVADLQVDASERTNAAAAANDDAYERAIIETLGAKQAEYERLSTTFRFAPGSDDLDAKGQRDLLRMYEFLKDRNPSEVVVVGFTDNKGSFDANLLVAEQRAAGVIKKIKAASAEQGLDGATFTALGFGELSPVACNSKPKGRGVNRRVEVWIK